MTDRSTALTIYERKTVTEINSRARGTTPVLPDKLNPSIPDDVWEQIQETASKASERLNKLIVDDEQFSTLTRKEQLGAIALAQARAYGSMDGGVRKTQVTKEEENIRGNAMTELARKAHRQLPEFAKVTPLYRGDKEPSE